MEGHGERMSRDTETAISALLACASIRSAAKKIKIAEKTLRSWLKETEFAAAYRAARRAVVEQAITQTQQLTGDAVKALKRNLKCGVPAVEVRAALGVLESASKGVELTDLLERIEALEADAEKRKAEPSNGER